MQLNLGQRHIYWRLNSSKVRHKDGQDCNLVSLRVTVKIRTCIFRRVFSRSKKLCVTFWPQDVQIDSRFQKYSNSQNSHSWSTKVISKVMLTSSFTSLECKGKVWMKNNTLCGACPPGTTPLLYKLVYEGDSLCKVYTLLHAIINLLRWVMTSQLWLASW